MNITTAATAQVRSAYPVGRHATKLDGEFWGVTAYFNPAGYSNKRHHLSLFSSNLKRQGLRLLIVELAFGDRPFELGEAVADQVVRVRSNTVLWHKERLLNLGMQNLPETCDKVAWLDGDILFENDNWVTETSELLNEYIVVQPFSIAWSLPPGFERRLPHMADKDFRAQSVTLPGAVYSHVVAYSRQDLTGGHTGFAWSARRSLLKKWGLYERSILGGADHIIAAAMYHPFDAEPTQRWLQEFCPAAQLEELSLWYRQFHLAVERSVYFTNGTILHLWHGNSANRRYLERHGILCDAEFDPRKDISLDANQCWQWCSNKPELHRRVREYFWGRKEDGFQSSPVRELTEPENSNSGKDRAE